MNPTRIPQDLTEEALALAAAASAKKFLFVGTSIGGAIGQKLISQHPDRLISVTLTNTGAITGTFEAWDTRSAHVLELGLITMAVAIVPRWFGPSVRDRQPAAAGGWRKIMGREDNRSYALLREMLACIDFREQLRGHRVPLPLIGGSDDVTPPSETLKALALDLPRCTGDFWPMR